MMNNRDVPQWVTDAAKIIVKCLSQMLLGMPPIATLIDEVTSFGIDKVAEKVGQGKGYVHQNVREIFITNIPPMYHEHKEIICTAAEICMENLDLLKQGFNAGDIARNLSLQYIRQHPGQFGEGELAHLRRYLPIVLENAIFQLEVQLENDPEFQVKWKLYVEDQFNCVREEQAHHKRQLADHEERIRKQEFRTMREVSQVAELSDFYREKWEDSLFLDEDISLRQVYQLPHYDDDEPDLHLRLQEMLDQSDDSKKRMLVVLGHPGSGKSSLITYLLNNCFISNDRKIRVYRFSNFETIDWNRTTQNLPQAILRELCLDKSDLNNSVLILDGLDEVDMIDDQIEFLDYLYGQWAKSKTINNFSMLVTCRANRIAEAHELQCPYLTLCPLDVNQINSFSKAYGKAAGPLFSQSAGRDEELRNALGIPLILYMTLALGIEVQKGSHLGDVYHQIFSLTDKNSIYFRAKYDGKHAVTAAEADKIHVFSKKIAEKIWEFNPSEASLVKSIYEPIAREIAGDGESQLRKLLIGQFFMEGQEGHELLFVHRSMYEYFVALSLFDGIEAIVNLHSSPKDLFKQLTNENHVTGLSQIANLIGIQSLPEYPDVQEYLLNMLNKNNLKDKCWWFEFFNEFIQHGLSDAANERIKGGQVGIKEEVNRFYNLVWLTREILKILGARPPYKIWDERKTPIYFSIPTDSKKDLSELDLEGIELPGANLSDVEACNTNFSEAFLVGADFANSCLIRANLRNAVLFGVDLSGAYMFEADLKGADLRNANLSGADLSGADLSEVNFQGADLRNVDLSGASLVGAVLVDVNFEGAILKEANFSNSIMKNVNLSGFDL